MAGIAAGIAVSVKLPLLAPVGAITVGMILVSGRGRRLITAAWLGIPMVIVGGYWYLRAAIHTGGNPIPQSKFGPLHLPTPNQMPLDPRPRFSVADYIFNPTIYRKWFFPQLENALGPLWPLILIIAVAAAVYIAVRSRNKVLRVIAAAALLTAVVYVFTPLTAAGQEGSPTGFFTNTRYLMPGLLLALTLVPIARPLRAPDSRAWQTLIFLTVVYAITVLTTPRWYPGYIVGTIFLTLALVWAPAGLGLMRARGEVTRGVVAIAGAGILLFAVVLGRAQEVQYYKQPLHPGDAVPPGRRAAPGLHLRPQPARQADRDRRLRRDLLRPVRVLRRQPRQLRPVHRGPGPARASTGSRPPAGSSAAGSTTANTTT